MPDGRAPPRLGEALDLSGVDSNLAAGRSLAPGLPASVAPAAVGRRSAAPARPLPRGRPPAPHFIRLCPRPSCPLIRTWPWPVPDRARVWPAFPQNPVFISKSVPTASIRARRLQAVADQGRAAARLGHLAALDQIALRDAEDEVAPSRARPGRPPKEDRVRSPFSTLGDHLLRVGRRQARYRCWSSAVSAGPGRWPGGPLPVDSTWFSLGRASRS